MSSISIALSGVLRQHHDVREVSSAGRRTERWITIHHSLYFVQREEDKPTMHNNIYDIQHNIVIVRFDYIP